MSSLSKAITAPPYPCFWHSYLHMGLGKEGRWEKGALGGRAGAPSHRISILIYVSSHFGGLALLALTPFSLSLPRNGPNLRQETVIIALRTDGRRERAPDGGAETAAILLSVRPPRRRHRLCFSSGTRRRRRRAARRHSMQSATRPHLNFAFLSDHRRLHSSEITTR